LLTSQADSALHHARCVSLQTMSLSPEDIEYISDQLGLLGDHLAELHDRIDPDDERSMDSLRRAVEHYNDMAKLIDPDEAIEWPGEPEGHHRR
jgi:hypothetical protein